MKEIKYKEGDKIRLVSLNYIIKHYGESKDKFGAYKIAKGCQVLTIIPDMFIYLGKEYIIYQVIEDIEDENETFYRIACENTFEDKLLYRVSDFMWKDWIFRKPLDELLLNLKSFCNTCIKECEGEDCIINNIIKKEL